MILSFFLSFFSLFTRFFSSEGLTSSMIQKYFKPHRAIAVNVRATDKAADVAFKSHEAAVAAMEKQGEELNEATCTLTLSSTAE